MTVAVALLAALVCVLAASHSRRLARRIRPPRPGASRILVPFTGGTLDPSVLEAAIRIAQAEHATLVPAYLLQVPLQYAEDSPLAEEVSVAMPLLEAVEHAALRAGVPVDARIEKGRTSPHALKRLWQVEHFDRVIAPAPAQTRNGFTPKDLTWILTNSPTETVVLKPSPADAAQDAHALATPRQQAAARRWEQTQARLPRRRTRHRVAASGGRAFVREP